MIAAGCGPRPAATKPAPDRDAVAHAVYAAVLTDELGRADEHFLIVSIDTECVAEPDPRVWNELSAEIAVVEAYRAACAAPARLDARRLNAPRIEVVTPEERARQQQLARRPYEWLGESARFLTISAVGLGPDGEHALLSLSESHVEDSVTRALVLLERSDGTWRVATRAEWSLVF